MYTREKKNTSMWLLSDVALEKLIDVKKLPRVKSGSRPSDIYILSM